MKYNGSHRLIDSKTILNDITESGLSFLNRTFSFLFFSSAYTIPLTLTNTIYNPSVPCSLHWSSNFNYPVATAAAGLNGLYHRTGMSAMDCTVGGEE